MKHLSILFLILIIVISGCVGQDGIISSAKDGLIITDFSFEYSPIYARDNVGLRLEVQNVGGSDAEIEKIQVYGVDFNCVDSTRAWCNKGVYHTEFDGTYIGENRFLDRPNTEINFEGGKYYQEWRLKAPSGVTSETDYDFRVRVEYNYNTFYSGIIRVVDEGYLQSLSEEEKEELFSSGGIVSSELTNGPISVTPFSGRHFILDDMEDRTIKFKIENVGKGYPYICEKDLDCVYDDTDAIKGVKKYHVRIKEITGGIIKCEGGEREIEIKLSSGESHIIYCTFMPSRVGKFTNKVDKTFQIELEYSYYVDDSTSITVKPIY